MAFRVFHDLVIKQLYLTQGYKKAALEPHNEKQAEVNTKVTGIRQHSKHSYIYSSFWGPRILYLIARGSNLNCYYIIR